MHDSILYGIITSIGASNSNRQPGQLPNIGGDDAFCFIMD